MERLLSSGPIVGSNYSMTGSIEELEANIFNFIFLPMFY
jgi:hypothetical protein